jgi:YD repeat-containing protein
MHSYWDDFWALLGYKDAAAIATALGRDADAARLRAARDELRVDLDTSIAAARAAHAIDYLPGCAELGDFDATSTTIALSPGGELAALPQDALNATFERYWKEFIARRDGRTEWKAYTPYEWRAVGTFVRLGWRERALAAIEYFMRDRRPVEWNQWAEVVGKDPRESRFVGDMPHGWVASDFIRSVLDLFAWERDRDGALVLASGIPDDWLGGEGIAIDDLRTPYGRLSYTLRRDATGTHLHIDGNGLPPGGFVYAPRGNLADARVTINGKRTRIEKGELRITVVPAEIAIAR